MARYLVWIGNQFLCLCFRHGVVEVGVAAAAVPTFVFIHNA
jgi:hypothetical protein